MKTYRYSNGRIIKRDNKGRFKPIVLSDIVCFDECLINADKRLVCSKCGYSYMPLMIPLPDGRKCRKCGNSMDVVKIRG